MIVMVDVNVNVIEYVYWVRIFQLNEWIRQREKRVSAMGIYRSRACGGTVRAMQ